MRRKNKNLFKTTKSLLIISLFVIGMLSINEGSIYAKNSFLYESDYSTNDYIEVDEVVEWGFHGALETPTLYPGGRIFINITVLSSSLSNVSFTFAAFEGIVWSPIPPNFPLQPGENYSNTFTLVSSSIDNAGTLIYSAYILIENATATVRFGYDVLDKGTEQLPSTTSFAFFITISIIVIALNISMRKKAQK